jgi:phospholipase C
MTIQHLVVLMLENCSFDRMLGFSRPASPTYAGLTGNESNPTDSDTSSISPRVAAFPLPLADYTGFVTDPDPKHELSDVTLQVFGAKAPRGSAANNEGFVTSYRQLAPDRGAHVMGCFSRNQMRAVTALADEFVVFDHWHASVPGPTWPNRFFAHCATSGGHADSPSDATVAGSEVLDVFPMPTVFGLLQAAGRSWKVYYHDVPQALALSQLHALRGHFEHVGAFKKAATEGILPSYSFIEPAYFNLLGNHANDMHPSHDLRFGDKLVAEVYNALRGGPQWNDAALLVVWDEHGGFFDHVPPPDGRQAAISLPPDRASQSGSTFQFDRLGIRVPAILASPLVPRGAVVNGLFEHSAIPATVRKLFGRGPALSKRDAISNTFDVAASLDAPRPTPVAIPFTSPPDSECETKITNLSGTQKRLVALANSLDVQGLTTSATASLEGSIARVARFLDV